MHSIRTSIICSSVLLAAWLTASYTNQLDPAQTQGENKHAMGNAGANPQGHHAAATATPKQNVAPPATPMARVK
ncbi:MAG: hypothetical protein KJO21_03655 [Verrucomicrobiae bacterium]|nr:hypothetical protein [Verrucomicrobiae bacterium]NNJ42594.1 hypothetical protein [Akkermansiaceae bacterium]